MRKELIQRLVSHINRKHWWHCPPQDPKSYKKRGKFFASSFGEAELYGRSLDEPQRVKVCNPLVGSEDHVLCVQGIARHEVSALIAGLDYPPGKEALRSVVRQWYYCPESKPSRKLKWKFEIGSTV